MLENFIVKRPDMAFLEHILHTFEHVSRDADRSMNKSQRKVINFDKVAEIHGEAKKTLGVYSSNDALYVTEEGTYYFIEFKNGSLGSDKKLTNVRNKICTSILLALDMNIIPCYRAIKNKTVYILVYNEEHKSNAEITGDILGLAKVTPGKDVHLDFAWLFKETYAYSKQEFESEFIQKVVEPDHQKASV